MAEINESKNFIHAFIDEDIAEGGRYAGQTVHTRFPPEPNGYLRASPARASPLTFSRTRLYFTSGKACHSFMLLSLIHI